MAALLLCPPATSRCAAVNPVGNGSGKHSHRLLSSLQASDADPDRLMGKLVSSSSKSSLKTLSRLLSQSSPFALPMYQKVSESHWFKWSPKLAAAVISLLQKQNLPIEAHALMSESISRLNSPRDLVLFHCDLIDAFSHQGLENPVLESYARLREIPFSGRRPYQSMIKGLSLMGMATHAEAMLEEMAATGFKPSPFEFRSVVQSYGRLGLFRDMLRVLEMMRDAGFAVDTTCGNVLLSCYGDHWELSEMVSWLRKMRESGVDFSVRTFNAVLNSCPMLGSMMRDVPSLPLSVDALVRKLEEESQSPNEALLVRELGKSSVFLEVLEWSPSEGKLDLHGFHTASAYVTILQWLEEMRLRFSTQNIVPLEISIVCGSGRHSSKRRESPIKLLVSDMMFRLKSPMRIDRKNVGRFVARGKVVSDWLCQSPN